MKQLKLLGGASIDTGGAASAAVTGRAVQRRRIALLALLSVRYRSGLSRDKLIAYLWPDADSERGRHLLSDSVYRINQELGSETISAVGDELRLDCLAVGCDVLEFENAVTERALKRAVELYAGPFLDGFFLSECVELERWIEQERDRLAREYLAVLEALGDAASAAGDRDAAVVWWRRAATQDPYSSRIALRLMQALAAAGNRPGALQHAQLHAALVRSDFGTEPDTELAAYAERLKRGVDQPSAVAPPPVASVPPVAPPPATAPNVDSAVADPPVDLPPRVVRAEEPRRRSSALWWSLAAGALAAVPLVVLLVRNSGSPTPAPVATASADTLRSIAVLPFVNLSTDAENEYFADGITDELTAALDRIQGLRVAARTSSFAFKGKATDIREVANRLSVTSIVEGTVRKDARRIRIAARLIDAKTGYRLWSEEYDRELSDVLTIQGEIARAIASALEQRLTPEPNEQLARDIKRDPEAYELYLKGRFAWHQRTEQSLREAREYFEGAVARVPSYARAWAGLGDAYAVSSFYDYVPPREGYPRAEAAARRALALDSTLAAPHATIAYVNLYYHWNWRAAEASFQRAIRLAPEYSTAHQWYGNFLTAMGRFDEANAAFQRASEAEPLSLIAAAAAGWGRYYAGAYDEARAHFVHTLALEPTYQLAHLWGGQAYDASGRPTLAVAALTHAAQLSNRSSLTLAALAHALARSGQRDSARRLVAEIEARASAQYVPSYEVAKVHIALGDTALGLDWLERAYRERAHSMVLLKVDPQLAGVQRHARFAALLDRVGLK